MSWDIENDLQIRWDIENDLQRRDIFLTYQLRFYFYFNTTNIYLYKNALNTFNF